MFDIFVGTGVLMATITISMLIIIKLEGFLTNMQRISWLFIMVFGSATLLLRDDFFIKLKVSLISFVFFALLAFYKQFKNRNLIKEIFDGKISAKDLVWDRILIIWMALFILEGVSNLLVMAYFSTDIWMNFKVWYLSIASILCSITSIWYLKKSGAEYI